jgi:hypothetical protein
LASRPFHGRAHRGRQRLRLAFQFEPRLDLDQAALQDVDPLLEGGDALVARAQRSLGSSVWVNQW